MLAGKGGPKKIIPEAREASASRASVSGSALEAIGDHVDDMAMLVARRAIVGSGGVLLRSSSLSLMVVEAVTWRCWWP